MDERGARAVRLFQDRYGPVRHGAGPTAVEELLRAFAELPYENLSKIVAWNRGRGPATPASSLLPQAGWLRDPLTVVSDHLALGTGGTCFSLTELLRALLEEAGLIAEPVMAHMRHGPNIHCALRVQLAGRSYLCDPGYLLDQPLALASCPPDGELAPGQPFLVRAGSLAGAPGETLAGDFDLFTTDLDGSARWRYRFSDRATSREEFLGHWQRSFSLPAMRSLLATRRRGEELLYLHNHKLRRQGAGRTRTQNVRAELPGSLQRVFGIDPEISRRALELLRDEREAWRRARPAREGRTTARTVTPREPR